MDTIHPVIIEPLPELIKSLTTYVQRIAKIASVAKELQTKSEDSKESWKLRCFTAERSLIQLASEAENLLKIVGVIPIIPSPKQPSTCRKSRSGSTTARRSKPAELVRRTSKFFPDHVQKGLGLVIKPSCFAPSIIYDTPCQLTSESAEYSLIIKPDLFKPFINQPHINWAAAFQNKPTDVFIISALTNQQTGNHEIIFNSKRGFEQFQIPVQKGKPKKYLEQAIMKLPALTQSPVRLCCIKDPEAKIDICSIEDEHPQIIEWMQISIIPVNKGQVNPLEMMKENKTRSQRFNTFLEILGIDMKEYSPRSIFKWASQKIEYFVSTEMNGEEVRRLVGNAVSVIFFNDSDEPLDVSQVDKMGSVPTHFIVVQPTRIPGKYQVACFHRIKFEYHPLVPEGYLFGGAELKEFICIKFCNGLMTSRLCPPHDFFWQTPRLASITEVVERHLSPKELALLSWKK